MKAACARWTLISTREPQFRSYQFNLRSSFLIIAWQSVMYCLINWRRSACDLELAVAVDSDDEAGALEGFLSAKGTRRFDKQLTLPLKGRSMMVREGKPAGVRRKPLAHRPAHRELTRD
ncbi:hypothetical protein [Bradyrhizobium lupini]|uniref:hypothetical protein n=1 Tax=Rhizobium lupini TaxID=136996 RepID=UPI0034C5F451